MFAGHVGAALALGRGERRVNIGVFVAAAMLLDFTLWVLVLMGWESVIIPADFARTHQVRFVFSHWLLDALVHRPEMPLLGSSSRMAGLGLWNHMPVALAMEAVIALIAVCALIAWLGKYPRERAA